MLPWSSFSAKKAVTAITFLPIAHGCPIAFALQNTEDNRLGRRINKSTIS
jgi:hypothetical protein